MGNYSTMKYRSYSSYYGNKLQTNAIYLKMKTNFYPIKVTFNYSYKNLYTSISSLITILSVLFFFALETPSTDAK